MLQLNPGRRQRRTIPLFLFTLFITTALAAQAQAFGFFDFRIVSSDADSGRGSFRAAVEAANHRSSISLILFLPGVDATLESDVEYTGSQLLVIAGFVAIVRGAETATPAETWDGGLIKATGGGDLKISSLSLLNSFNNGIGVFVPADATGTQSLTLHRVTIRGARFHGVFFDGQLSTGFNTDDVLHPECEDPYPFDSDASHFLTIGQSTISGNGTLAGGFQTGPEFVVDGVTFLKGCPADFDGVRVDDGGLGDITALVSYSHVDDNLADGIEYDESEDGSVKALMFGSSVSRNGETGTDDLDDGFDIDEAGEGDLEVLVVNSEFLDNRDEGLDFDEDDGGSVDVALYGVVSSRNEDEGFKIDETGDGDLVALVQDSVINESLSQQGIDLTEEDEGDYSVQIIDSAVKFNDDEGVASEQVAPGTGLLTIIDSDLTENGDPSLDLTGVTADITNSDIDL